MKESLLFDYSVIYIYIAFKCRLQIPAFTPSVVNLAFTPPVANLAFIPPVTNLAFILPVTKSEFEHGAEPKGLKSP
jgi:hypothetical protein